MANVYIKPEVVISTALGLLQREIMLPGTVWLNGLVDFAGAKNDTVSIRVGGKLQARSRALRATGNARNIIMDTLTETKVDVTLNTDIYSAVPITDEELRLDIRDFGVQILQPQTLAVAYGLEDGLVATMQGGDYSFTDSNGGSSTVIVDASNTYNSFVDARKRLNDRNVPFSDRYAVVGSGIEAAILKDPHFNKYDGAGDTQALRNGAIGRIAGFDVIISNALDSDEGYVYHRTGFVMVTAAPIVPQGATFGATQEYLGLAMRWLKDYDFTSTTDRSLVDAYVGYKQVAEPDASVRRSVRLELASTSITMTPATATLAVAGTQALVVKDSSGAIVPNKAVTFVSGTPAKATVDTFGLVTAVATGTSTITATYQGQTATCAITVS